MSHNVNNCSKSGNRNVLMICGVFPPESYVGGLRPAMFSKYLPYYGWKPIVFTRKRPEYDPLWQPTMEIQGLPLEKDRINIIYGSDSELRATKKRNNSLLLKGKYFLFPDMAHPPGLLDSMKAEIPKITSEFKIDAVWATYDPLCTLAIASRIANMLNVPWIADFRDIHEQEQAKGFRTKLLHLRWLFRRKAITKTSSGVVTVSEYHAKLLESKLNREVHVIKNGFDPDIFYPFPPHRSKKFKIVYMGTIWYEWLRNPKPLFEALDLLIRNGDIEMDDLEISFYGTEPSLLKELAKSYKCRDLISALPRIAFQDVPKLLQRSCVNLVLTNIGRHGILTTKVFEYLAVKRNILCVPGDGGELDELIKKTNAGISTSNVNDIANALKKWYDEWKNNGTVVCNSSEDHFQQYSRKKQTAQLANLLNKFCSQC